MSLTFTAFKDSALGFEVPTPQQTARVSVFCARGIYTSTGGR